jgi:hypothetical protein
LKNIAKPVEVYAIGSVALSGAPLATPVNLQQEEGRNHIPLEHEPAAQQFFEEIRLFLGGGGD